MSKNENIEKEEIKIDDIELDKNKEFWEDKLLELKLLSIKKEYEKVNINTNLESEINRIIYDNSEKLKKIEELKTKISEIKQQKEKEEKILLDIKSDIDKIIEKNNEINNQITQINTTY